MNVSDSLRQLQMMATVLLAAALVTGCVPREDGGVDDNAAPDTVGGGNTADAGSDDEARHDAGAWTDTSASEDASTRADTGTSPDTAPVADTGDERESDDESDASDGTTFRITSPRSDRAVNYRLKVVKEPSKIRDGSRFEAEEGNDDIAQTKDGWLVSGETGTAPSADQVHGDSFRWPAAQKPKFGIAGWTADAPAEDYTIMIDGTEVDPSSLPALDTDMDSGSDSDSDSDGSSSGQAGCVGGGSCYQRTMTAADADITVGASADLDDLQSALDRASSGDIVFVDPQAEIDLGYNPDSLSLEVPAGVTLASNRGVDGSDGARLHADKKPGSDWQGSDTIGLNDNSRVTGLRIEGPTPDKDMNWLGADHDYTDGLSCEDASDVEIDNNEVYGWPDSGINSGDPVHVHHNYIHDNDQSGLGYGVSSPEWGSVIEYNQFRRNRHAIAGSGDAGVGYIARYNIFGAEGIGGAGHKIDMHEDGDTGKAGARVEIYRNTIKFPDAQGVYLRGTPRESSEIYKNWFYNPNQPCLTKNEGGDYCAIQVRAGDFTNVDYHDNHYGNSEPACDIGAPRKGC